MPSRRNDVATQNVDYRFFHPTLAGNGILACIAAQDGVTFTMTDDQGNTYANEVSDDDTGNGAQITIFYASSVATGTRRVRFQTSANAQFQVCEIVELWGISTTGTLVGSSGRHGTASGNSWFAPAFTPTSFPAFVYQAAVCTVGGDMSSFGTTMGELLSANRIDAFASQCYTVSSGSTTPTMQSDNTGYQSVAVALLIDNAQGTPCPTNTIRCRSMQMWNTGHVNAASVTDQFPCLSGNLLMGQWQGALSPSQADDTITAFSDTLNSGYTLKTGIFFGGRVSGIYKIGATAGHDLTWTYTQSGHPADTSFLMYDMQAPSGQSFVFDQEVTGSGTKTGGTSYDTVTCTPSSSGVVFYQTQNAALTVYDMSGANFFIDNGSSPDEDGGPSSFHEDNGWGHSFVGGLATWLVEGTQPDVGTWSSVAYAFTLSGGGGPSTISLSEDGYMPSAAPAPGPLVVIY